MTFSTSPMIFLPSRISNSVTADVPLLVTEKFVGPAGVVIARGSQPRSDRVTVIVGPSTLFELDSSSLDEHATATRVMAKSARSKRRGTESLRSLKGSADF